MAHGNVNTNFAQQSPQARTQTHGHTATSVEFTRGGSGLGHLFNGLR